VVARAAIAAAVAAVETAAATGKRQP
jgi:hypothetical protein